LKPNRKKINFVVIESRTEHPIETYVGEYPNLMFLLRDKLLLDDFGQCGGVGRCATCIIKIKNVKGDSVKKERNEPATLSKMGYVEDDIRLSCQLYITTDIDECQIEILDL
jgi:2Fe-2S ferredoxin